MEEMEEKVDKRLYDKAKQLYDNALKAYEATMVRFWAISKALEAERETSDFLRIRLEALEREPYFAEEERKRKHIEEVQKCSAMMHEMCRSVMAREREKEMKGRRRAYRMIYKNSRSSDSTANKT